MDVIIRETNERKTLGIEDPKTGLDYTRDFIGNAGGFTFGDFEPVRDEYGIVDGYTCTQEVYDWWQSVMAVHEYAAELIARFREDVEDLEAIDGMEEIMQDVLSGDLDYFETTEELEKWFAETIDQYDIEMERFNDGSYYFQEA
jgi:hypothetical protein